MIAILPVLLAGIGGPAGLAGGAAAAGGAAGDTLVVSTAWLAERLGRPGLVVFHVGDRAGYEAGHLPGARHLAATVELSTPRVEGQLLLELPSRTVLDSVLSAKGVANDSRVVLYSAGGQHTGTARALFTLEYAGLRGRVSVLDGGFEAWQREGRPVTRDVPVVAATRFASRPDSSLVVDAAFVHSNLASPAVRIIDARDTSFYNGRETRQGRNGRIPGAGSFPFLEVTDSAGHFRPVPLLRAGLGGAGVKEGQTVVTYCHIGQQASLVWLAARLAGMTARLYDGSFQDWARRTELPVEGERRP